jgi:hypothetical protein
MNGHDRPATADDLSPQDRARYGQIENGVRDLHARIGQPFEGNGERVAAGLLERYKAAGLQGDVSGVHLSQANAYVKNGENIIGVVGDPNDPTNRTFHGKSADLISTPAHVSFERTIELDREQQQARGLQQQQTQTLAPQGPEPIDRGSRSLL